MSVRVSPPLLIALGLAAVTVAVALLTFARADAEAERDRIAAEALRLAGDVQAWSRTPAILGGGADSFALSGVTPEALGRDLGDGLALVALDTGAPTIVGRDRRGEAVTRITVWGPTAACLDVHPARAAPTAPPSGCAVWTEV